jgi:hypothetical protein
VHSAVISSANNGADWNINAVVLPSVLGAGCIVPLIEQRRNSKKVAKKKLLKVQDKRVLFPTSF